MNIKGIDKIKEASKNVNQSDPSTWMPIFYNFKTNTVSTDPNAGAMVTKLIRENSEDEIAAAVKRWLMM